MFGKAYLALVWVFMLFVSFVSVWPYDGLATCPMTAGIGSSPHVTLNQFKRV